MKLLHYLWLAAGFVFLGIGMLGVCLPILPTTPFLLGTVFCFTKGSVRLHKWFVSTKLYQNHVKKFNENRAMTLKTKAIILGFASLMLTLGFYFSNNIVARILIVLLIFIKYYVFIFKIKTIPEPRTHEHEV